VPVSLIVALDLLNLLFEYEVPNADDKVFCTGDQLQLLRVSRHKGKVGYDAARANEIVRLKPSSDIKDLDVAVGCSTREEAARLVERHLHG
jgi:hypothetical protein